MTSVARAVREARGSLGLTQMELAVISGVSLATVQKLETDRANPSVGTLRRILASLGLGLAIEPGVADWDALAAHGLPLRATVATESLPAAETLVTLVRGAMLDLSRRVQQQDRERERESLRALLHALRSHFPSRFHTWFHRSPLVRELLEDEPSGRVIKLARIARDSLAAYL